MKLSKVRSIFAFFSVAASWLVKILILLFPFVFVFAPLPFVAEYDNSTKRTVVVALLLFLSLAFLFALTWAKKRPSRRFTRRGVYTLALLGPVVGITCLSSGGLPPFLAAYLLLALITVFSAIFLAHEDSIAGPGVISLLLFLGFVFSVELTFRATPERYLLKEIIKTPPLTAPERSVTVFQKNGFQGKWPCKACDTDRLVRIFTMGGSSTYGVPMRSSAFAYSSQLQRLLDERRPGEQYEVLNGGVAGFGIMQVINVLNKELLKYKPDIVTVALWFNDSSTYSWYGIPGLSDRESHQYLELLRKVEKFPGYQRLHNTKLYALGRFYLHALRREVLKQAGIPKKKNRTRMTPKDYRWGLEEVVRLGKEKGFLPVFVLEPLNRSLPYKSALHSNKYYKTMAAVAEKHSVPLVDTLTPINEHSREWLFYDFIHPNRKGHRLIAETIYKTLFSKEQVAWAKQLWAAKQIDLNKPFVEKSPFYQFSQAELSGKMLTASVRAPHALMESRGVSVMVNDSHSFSYDLTGNAWQKVTIDPALVETMLPLNSFTFKLEPVLRRSEAWRIGTSERFSPVYIRAESGGKNFGWKSLIEVGGKRVDHNWRGYNVVAVGALSGDVKARKSFDLFRGKDENLKLKRFVEDLKGYREGELTPIVIVAVKADGHHHADMEILPSVFRSLGGSGNLPGAFESFLLIGAPGLEPGSAWEAYGPRLIQTEIGNPESVAAALLEVKGLELK
ncbi:GDSL-type esterase/lipase family protein [Oligoflexia bacterium]|nr:GDSL-type esterase/lipase family protein [Oligoflexia bacterium]